MNVAPNTGKVSYKIRKIPGFKWNEKIGCLKSDILHVDEDSHI
jgi:hypothetical protein